MIMLFSKLRCPCCRKKLQTIYSQLETLTFEVKCLNCAWKRNINKGSVQRDIDYLHLQEKEREMRNR